MRFRDRSVSAALAASLMSLGIVAIVPPAPAFAMSVEEIVNTVYSEPFDVSGDVPRQAASFISGQELTILDATINGLDTADAYDAGYLDSFGTIHNLSPVTGFDAGLIISADASVNYLNPDEPNERVSGANAIVGSDAATGSFAELVQVRMDDTYGQDAYSITSLELTLEPLGPYLALDFSVISGDGNDGDFGDQAVIAVRDSADSGWLDYYSCLHLTDAPLAPQYLGVAGEGVDPRADFGLAQTNLVSFISPYLEGVPGEVPDIDPSLTSPYFDPIIDFQTIPAPNVGIEIDVPGQYTAQVSLGLTCIIDVSYWYENDRTISLGLGVANGSDDEVSPALIIREGSLGFVQSATPIPLGMETASGAGYAFEQNLIWVPGFAMVSEGDFVRFGDAASGQVSSVEFGVETDSFGADFYGITPGTLGTFITFTSEEDNYISDPMSQPVAFAFNPVGPQVGVPESRLSGWTKCEENVFSEYDLNFDDILEACAGDQVMMAAQQFYSSVVSLLATSDFSSFVQEKPVNDPELVNGTYWYYDRDLSIGFSLDPTIQQDTCDVADETQEAAYPEYRMCWHLYQDEVTTTSYLEDGYRLGFVSDLGGPNADIGTYVRQLYSLDLESFVSNNQTIRSQIVTPYSTWVPADSVIPDAGSTVQFTWLASDVGIEAATYLNEQVTSATVKAVISDYPFYCGEVDVCIANEGDLGFAIVFEAYSYFEGFEGPFNFYIDVMDPAQSFDGVYVEGVWTQEYEDSLGLWLPPEINASQATRLIDDWGGEDDYILDVATNVPFACPSWVPAEPGCENSPEGDGTFVALYVSPTDEERLTFLDRFGEWFDSYTIVLGASGQMESPYSAGGAFCEARSGELDGEVFLGGQYLELGISETGSFGTLGDSPDFMRGTDADSRIGMGADLDGYCSGLDLPIDYFLPGSPEERWTLGFVENEGDEPRYISYAPVEDYRYEEDIREYDTSDGDLTIFGVTENVSSEERLRSRSTVAIYDDGQQIFEVLITHSFDPQDRFYRSDYVVANTSDRDFYDVRLMRNVDPDNTVYQNDEEGPFDAYFTRNTILDQVSEGGTAQVQATAYPEDPFVALLADVGLDTDVPLVFYSSDPRAVVSTGGFSEANPYQISESEGIDGSSDDTVAVSNFDPVNQIQPVDFYVDCDCAIQMTATLGSLIAEDSIDTFTMYTSLDARDFSEVIDEVVQDENDLNLLFPITPFTPENLFSAAPTSILWSGLSNVKVNNLDAEEFALLDDEGKAIAGAFGSFSGAERILGLDSGFVINPGYRADAFGYESQGDGSDEEFFDPDTQEAFVGIVEDRVGFDLEALDDSPIGALAQAIAIDPSIPVEVDSDYMYQPTSLSFSMTPEDRYVKLDFVLGTTEPATYNPETGAWEGFAAEYPDAFGIFIKEAGSSWLDASNCAAIPTTNSIVSIFNTRILPPGSPSDNRPIAEDNYNNLVAKTAKNGYNLDPESFVDRFLVEDEAPFIAPPGISISNRQLGSVLKFVTVPMTCVVDVDALGLESDEIEIGIAVANLYDPILPPALFVSANSIRFSSNQIAAPDQQVASIQEIAELLPELEIDSIPVSAAPYQGPVITDGPLQALPGNDVTFNGRNLGTVSSVEIDGRSMDVAATSTSITFTIPGDLVSGTFDLTLISEFGRLQLPSMLTVLSSELTNSSGGVIGSVKRIGDTARIFATNIIGAGKVQLFVNGREIAWVRAVDETDPKLRNANDTYYLVRRFELAEGKNVIEIYVDGVRIRRVAYTK